MPLLLKYSFHRETIFFVNLGVYAGRLLGQYTVFEEFDYKRDDTHLNNRWDFGLVGGFGGEYPINDYLYWTFDVRYSRGLVNISKVPVIDDGKIQTQAFSVLLGLSVQFPGKR